MENVPVHVNGPTSVGRSGNANAHAAGNGPHDVGRQNKRKNKMVRAVMVGVLAVVIIAVAVCGWLFYQSSMASAIDGSKYQAVFFTNGQVYFGKLHVMNGNYMSLTDVYYLQAQKASDKNPQQTSEDTTGVELVKLGGEVHGPEDQMVISKDQVLFFENLKKDGKVSTSIAQSQKKN
jgi:hypothetical protein